MTDYEIYLVSTPLHLFLASAIASQRSDKKNILVFIDQVSTNDNFYYEQVNKWNDSPFEETYIFPGRIKGFIEKRNSRKEIFSALDVIIEQFKPAQIYTGNDRRIEFQYSMFKSQEYGGAEGNYIDEGTYTYLGRPPSLGVGDMVVDSTIKKIAYGFWWKNPPTIGGSAWVTNVYAAFPNLVHPLLEEKNLIELSSEWLQSDSLNNFSAQLLATKDIDFDSIQAIDVLIALPHESIIAKNKHYKDSLISLISQLTAQGKNIAVKYHPRDIKQDALELQAIGCQLIPKQVNFEALLLIFPKNRTILGDFSSVLLNARWLRPDLRVIAALEDKTSVSEQLYSLYTSLKIEMVDVKELSSLNDF
tara:strand:- start:8958 stop:10040 length:1083 start_codon:yes stop_codon:yes gene_type:complete